MAIENVAKILEPYAYNNEFLAFGFGGIPRFMGQSSVNHCFNLSGLKDA
jgi:Copine